MHTPKFASTTIFILFFGMALIVAVQKHNWLAVLLFAALGAMSLWADLRSNRNAANRGSGEGNR